MRGARLRLCPPRTLTHPPPPFCVTVQGVYFMVAGQHTYSAAMAMKDEYTKRNRDVPRW